MLNIDVGFLPFQSDVNFPNVIKKATLTKCTSSVLVRFYVGRFLGSIKTQQPELLAVDESLDCLVFTSF